MTEAAALAATSGSDVVTEYRRWRAAVAINVILNRIRSMAR